MSKIDGSFTVDWADMPRTASFDDLIAGVGFNDYVERYGLWHIIFNNGVYYTQDVDDSEVGRKCKPLEVLCKVSIN